MIQGSEPAKVVGGIPTIPITVDGTNDSIDFEVDGFNFSVTLDHGTYNTEQALADACPGRHRRQHRSGRGGHRQPQRQQPDRAVDPATRAATARSSSPAARPSPTSASASGQAGSGVDGLVEVDGVVTAISDTTPGTTVTLASAGAGTIEATLSGGSSRTGTITAEQTTSGTTLQEVVNAVNSTDNGYSALAVNTGSGYRLQLTADETGAGSSGRHRHRASSAR